MEIWKDIAGYEGRYQVSNTGKVKSVPHRDASGHLYKGRILSQRKSGNYLVVHLSNGMDQNHYLVHRLVAAAFCKKEDGLDIVNHLDCNPLNNNAENLEWTTYKGNMEWASKLGRMKANEQTYINCKKAVEAKKTPVTVTTPTGEKLFFKSQTEAARSLGISRSHIGQVCKNKCGYKSIAGYLFQYA